MNIEILDYLKRKRDICFKTIIPSQNTAFMWTPTLTVNSDIFRSKAKPKVTCLESFEFGFPKTSLRNHSGQSQRMQTIQFTIGSEQEKKSPAPEANTQAGKYTACANDSLLWFYFNLNFALFKI